MLVLLIPSQSVFSCSNLPCPDSHPSLGRALFEYAQGLILTYEADQDVCLYYSLSTGKGKKWDSGQATTILYKHICTTCSKLNSIIACVQCLNRVIYSAESWIDSWYSRAPSLDYRQFTL